MPTKVIQTVSDAFIAKVNWLYDRFRGLSGSDLRQIREVLPDGPEDLICYVGSGGMAARSGMTISGIELPVYTTTGDITSGTMTMVAVTDGTGAPYNVMVYNVANGPITGPKYIVTTRMKTGLRYVVVEPCEVEQ